MPLTLKRSENLNTICLEGDIDIGCAAELKSLLVQALGSGREVQVSVATATNLDITAVQLLWAARRVAKALGARFAITGPLSESLTAALLQAGFEDFAANENQSPANGARPCQP